MQDSKRYNSSMRNFHNHPVHFFVIIKFFFFLFVNTENFEKKIHILLKYYFHIFLNIFRKCFDFQAEILHNIFFLQYKTKKNFFKSSILVYSYYYKYKIIIQKKKLSSVLSKQTLHPILYFLYDEDDKNSRIYVHKRSRNICSYVRILRIIKV